MSIAGYNWQCVTATVADPAADETNFLLIAPLGGIRIQEAYAVTESAITSDATNHVTVSLLDGGTDGTGTDSMGSYGGADTAWAANDANALTMTASELDEDAILLWKYDENGTVAPGNVTIHVWYSQGGSE